MATRGTISVVTEKTENGVGRTIYTHWDSYPSHNGRILLEHYQDANKVKELIDLGSISSLAENVKPSSKGMLRAWNSEKGDYDLTPTSQRHSFDAPHDGVVVAYMRDRGEEDCHASFFAGKEPNDNIAQEYDYLFVVEENKWYIRDNHKARPKFVVLTEKICNKN